MPKCGTLPLRHYRIVQVKKMTDFIVKILTGLMAGTLVLKILQAKDLHVQKDHVLNCRVDLHWNAPHAYPSQQFQTAAATLVRERIHWDQRATFTIPEVEGGSCTLTVFEKLDDDEPDAQTEVGHCTLPLSAFEAAEAPQEWHRLHATGAPSETAGSVLVQGLLTHGPGMGRRGVMGTTVARLVPLTLDADARIRREAISVLSQHVEPGGLEYMRLLVGPGALRCPQFDRASCFFTALSTVHHLTAQHLTNHASFGCTRIF